MTEEINEELLKNLEVVVHEQQPDVNELQASLTASKTLVAILETLGEVIVPTKTLFNANNKDKVLVVDYDESTGVPSFKFRLPKDEEMKYNADLVGDEDESESSTD